MSAGSLPLATKVNKDLDQGPEVLAIFSLSFFGGVVGEVISTAEQGESCSGEEEELRVFIRV
jgi:hypothetical protein